MTAPVPKARIGTVNVAANDYLNVRDEPSAKSPTTRILKRGEKVEILGEAKNGNTLWYRIASEDGGDYVAASYVTLA